MTEDDKSDKKKSHRARQAGVKAEKKQLKKQTASDKDAAATTKQRNPKAFAINSAIRGERNFRRKEDIIAKKQHIPLVDQTPDEPPPILVAVVGPPKVGKTTLISNLIRNFTRHNVTDISGPITVVISKKKRITLIECNNDINSMIDIAKCADLVLLLCDASFGFEMEIFEFLNICQVHGMPKIMGVLTHLDMIRNPKQLRKRKKELKHRFWTEVYDGAKLFYLSCMLHGQYLKNEVKNLGRFISVIKFRSLQWRSSHSYVVVDRVEDVTNTDLIRRNEKCDRDVILYGYVRGVPMKQEHMVHIAGLGDVRVDELSVIPDPCPLPGTEKKRGLLEKERLLYAPMSGVGGIVYDKDAIYIELHGSHSHKEKTTADHDEQDKLVERIIEKKKTVDEQMEEQEFKLFSNSATIKSKDFHDTNEAVNDGDGQNDGDDNENEDDNTSDDEQSEEDEDFDEDDDDDDDNDDDDSISDSSEDEGIAEEEDDEEMEEESDDDDSGDDEANDNEELIANSMSWKNDLERKARDAFLQHRSQSANLMRRVYGCYSQTDKLRIQDENAEGDESLSKSDSEDEELSGLFKVVTKKQTELHREKDKRDRDECSFFGQAGGDSCNWLGAENVGSIKNCFITGKWKLSEDAEALLKLDDLSDNESECYGDFEDLQTNEKFSGKPQTESLSVEDSAEADPAGENGDRKRRLTRVEEENLTKSELLNKKMKLKSKFDAEYDKEPKEESFRITGDHDFYESLKADVQMQTDLNKTEFSNLDADLRLQIEGFRAGLYVRMGFKNLPAEFIKHFDAAYPVLVGSLNMAEENIGYVNCKVKKHRWYKKILKTGDPLIISMGWRRFQTVPIYAKVEDNFRHRYLKYTPNHVTCSMSFFGPITPQNTGFLALQTLRAEFDNNSPVGFRIAATGCVTEVDKSTQIVKKLKLVGSPFKIYRKSAFIKGMFNSSIEVAKFEGAKIKTVSGIRGQIKKAHHTPEGSFRATFEDKILLSDIVFCRTWCRVDVTRFYAPVTSLLYAPEERTRWQGMKTMGELKRERDIRNEVQKDSLYTEVKRERKPLKPLVIPKALQRALPYEAKPKVKPSVATGKDGNETVTKILSSQEQKVAKLMKRIQTTYREKKIRDKDETKKRLKKFRAEKRLEEQRKLKRQKEIRTKISRAISKSKGKGK